MLNENKIQKLRELAERGIGGEMETAKRILTRHGIDWRKPKKNAVKKIIDTVTGSNEIKEYSVTLRHPSDILLLTVLVNNLTANRSNISIRNNRAIINCTKSEATQIANIYLDDEFASEFDFILRKSLSNIFK